MASMEMLYFHQSFGVVTLVLMFWIDFWKRFAASQHCAFWNIKVMGVNVLKTHKQRRISMCIHLDTFLIKLDLNNASDPCFACGSALGISVPNSIAEEPLLVESRVRQTCGNRSLVIM